MIASMPQVIVPIHIHRRDFRTFAFADNIPENIEGMKLLILFYTEIKTIAKVDHKNVR